MEQIVVYNFKIYNITVGDYILNVLIHENTFKDISLKIQNVLSSDMYKPYISFTINAGTNYIIHSDILKNSIISFHPNI